jgi:RNA polymerase subunit RPABC4/transcription elongation factor Spt4
MIFKVKCEKCKYVFNTAFGIVGTRFIAQPAKKCPQCHSKAIKNLGIGLKKSCGGQKCV